MAKNGTINARIDDDLKHKAKKMNINLSDAIEQTLKDKTKDTTISTLILQVDKYGISIIPNNYVVGRISDAYENPVQGNKKEIFDQATSSYHPSLHQALIALSKRFFDDKLKITCKDKALELRELARLIQEHHDWFVNIVRGM